MDSLPKYSADLIAELDAMVHPMNLDGLTARGWGHIDESRVRQLAYVAGQRALVDLLIGMQREVEESSEDKTQSAETHSGETELYERVFDPSGGEHKNVASVHMAGGFAREIGSDDSSE